jgi:hypothetical protein
MLAERDPRASSDGRLARRLVLNGAVARAPSRGEIRAARTEDRGGVLDVR